MEWLERFFDKHFLGTGAKSISPETEVAEAIRNGALILDIRLALEAKKAPRSIYVHASVTLPPAFTIRIGQR